MRAPRIFARMLATRPSPAPAPLADWWADIEHRLAERRAARPARREAAERAIRASAHRRYENDALLNEKVVF